MAKPGEIEVWGASASTAIKAVPPGDNFRMITPGGHSQSLAIQADGKLMLWGTGGVLALQGKLLNDAFTDGTVTPNLIIAIRADNQEIEIAGEFVHPTLGKSAAVVPPHLKSLKVMGVAAGGPHAVVIGLADQLLRQFGPGPAPCPGGKFTHVRARHGYTIGLDENGNLYGWGTPFVFPAPPGIDEEGPFPDFWESNPYFADEVPGKKRPAYPEPSWRRDPAGHWFVPGPFVDLAAGVRELGSTGDPHILALRPDGGVVGWGGNVFGQTQAPSGLKFLSIAAGRGYSVGIANNGEVHHWGQGAGPPSDPSARYQSIGAAVFHAAAVRGIFKH